MRRCRRWQCRRWGQVLRKSGELDVRCGWQQLPDTRSQVGAAAAAATARCADRLRLPMRSTRTNSIYGELRVGKTGSWNKAASDAGWLERSRVSRCFLRAMERWPSTNEEVKTRKPSLPLASSLLTLDAHATSARFRRRTPNPRACRSSSAGRSVLSSPLRSADFHPDRLARRARIASGPRGLSEPFPRARSGP